MRYKQQINVPLNFDVVFTRDLFDPANQTLTETLPKTGQAARASVFIDENVAKHWPDLIDRIQAWCDANPNVLKLVSRPMVVPGGEAVKNDLLFVQRMTHQYQRFQLCRHSYVIAIGGGAVLDAVGLSAAVWHRGIRLIRIPTTVLSQNDSGVGVKNGVNLDGVKNLIGSFAAPFAVLNDANFLTTLEQRDWISGLAEAFKVALIKDIKFFEELEADAAKYVARDLDAMERSVRRCAVMHLQHIAGGGDPFEFGSARPLDFGHWSAHKLESMTHYELRHGEAVSIGIALDVCLAEQLGLITAAERERVHKALASCGMPLWHSILAKRSTATGNLLVADGIEEFRQHLGGRLTLTLPKGLGQKAEVHEMDPQRVEKAVEFLQARFGVPVKQ
jgi:3-dehydroquinate synthase